MPDGIQIPVPPPDVLKDLEEQYGIDPWRTYGPGDLWGGEAYAEAKYNEFYTKISSTDMPLDRREILYEYYKPASAAELVTKTAVGVTKDVAETVTSTITNTLKEMFGSLFGDEYLYLLVGGGLLLLIILILAVK